MEESIIQEIIMNVCKIKRDNPLIRYIRIAFREAVTWNYMPLICVPAVWLTLFFLREYFFSRTKANLGLMGAVYVVMLLLGICMGMIAAGQLLNGRKCEAYRMLPCGRRGYRYV